MQEIALLLSSLAGIATAAAVRARTGYYSSGNKKLLTLGASSQIRSQVKTLQMEKEILAKTITRLYQSEEWDTMPRQYKEGLLAKYQHQLGVVMARLEKLEDAKNHPDLGPVGDGLITLMDQKMTNLDTKMYDMASDIADIKAVQKESRSKLVEPEVKEDKGQEAEISANAVAVAKEETKLEASETIAATTTTTTTTALAEAEAQTVRAAKKIAAEAAAAATPRVPEWFVPTPKSIGSFEIATLTSIPTNRPRSPNQNDTTASMQKEQTQQAVSKRPREQIVISPDTKEIRTSVTAKPPPVPTGYALAEQTTPATHTVVPSQGELPTIVPKPQEPTIVPKPQEPTIVPKPQEPTIVPKPQEPTIVPKPQEPTIVPKPQEPTIVPKPQEPTVTPQVPEPTIVPKPQEPTIVPKPQEPTVTPQVPEPTIVPKPQEPTVTPQVPEPTIVPKPQEPTIVPKPQEPTVTPQVPEPTIVPKPQEPTIVPKPQEPTVTPQVPEPTIVPKPQEPTIVPKPDMPTVTPPKVEQPIIGPKPQEPTVTPQVPEPTGIEDEDPDDAEMKEIMKNVKNILDKLNRAESE